MENKNQNKEKLEPWEEVLDVLENIFVKIENYKQNKPREEMKIDRRT